MITQGYIDRLASSVVRIWLPAGVKGGFVYLSDGTTKKVREETMTALASRDLFDDDEGGDGLRSSAGLRRVPFGVLYGRLYKGPPWRPSQEVLERCERRGRGEGGT